MSTTIERPYADIEPRLTTLAEEIIDQADRLEERARDLEYQAERNETRPPREEINRLRDQAETLRYQVRVLDEAGRICRGRGTAAELVATSYVLPPGYVAVYEYGSDMPETPRAPMRGRELRLMRESLGLSLRELGAVLDIPFNTLARWERGALTIQHPELLRLALERLQAQQSAAEQP